MHATGFFALGRKIIDYVFRPIDQAGLPSYATAGNVTYLASDFQQALITRDCNGSARSDVTPTAAQIIDSLTVSGRLPVPGNAVRFGIRNVSGTAVSITLTAGAGVTLVGTMTIAQNNSREFMLVVNSLTAVTIYSLGSSAF